MAQDIGMGAGELGAAFGGGRLLRKQAYNQRMGELAQAFAQAASGKDHMASADLKENQLGALQGGFEQALIANGMDPNTARVQAQAFAANAGQNLNTTMQGLGRAQMLGNVGDMTRNAMAAGEPIYKTSGGVDINQYTGESGTNPLGDAMVAAQKATAGERNAQAQRARAGVGVDKAGNYSIETDADGNMVRVNKLTGQVSPLTQGDAPLKAPPKGGAASKFGSLNPTQLATFFPAADMMSPTPFDATKAAEAQTAAWNAGARTPEQFFEYAATGKVGGGADTSLTSQPDAGGDHAGVARPATPADFAALPKGALYVNPRDGKTYRKK